MVGANTGMARALEQPGSGALSLKEFHQTMVTVRTSLFSEKEIGELKGYLLDENGAVPSRKAISDLFNLTRDLVNKMAYQIRQAQGERAKTHMALMEKEDELSRLKAELERLREENRQLAASTGADVSTGFTETGIDSLDLAKAVCFRSKEQGHVLYRNQVQTIMYILYGKHLARCGARLTTEHPQMWEYGPVFPRVYSKLKDTSDDGYRTEYEALITAHPDVAMDMEDTVTRCSWKSCRELLSVLTAAGSPWAAARGRCPDRKTAPSEDSEIREWFKNLRQ